MYSHFSYIRIDNSLNYDKINMNDDVFSRNLKNLNGISLTLTLGSEELSNAMPTL